MSRALVVAGIGAAVVFLGWYLPSEVHSLRRRAWYGSVLVLQGGLVCAVVASLTGTIPLWAVLAAVAVTVGNGAFAKICDACGRLILDRTHDSPEKCPECDGRLSRLWQRADSGDALSGGAQPPRRIP
jgi:hypothetical protein